MAPLETAGRSWARRAEQLPAGKGWGGRGGLELAQGLSQELQAQGLQGGAGSSAPSLPPLLLLGARAVLLAARCQLRGTVCGEQLRLAASTAGATGNVRWIPSKKTIQNYLANKLKSQLVTTAGNCSVHPGGAWGWPSRARRQFSPGQGIIVCVFPAGSELPRRSRTAPGGPAARAQGRHQWDATRGGQQDCPSTSLWPRAGCPFQSCAGFTPVQPLAAVSGAGSQAVLGEDMDNQGSWAGFCPLWHRSERVSRSHLCHLEQGMLRRAWQRCEQHLNPCTLWSGQGCLWTLPENWRESGLAQARPVQLQTSGHSATGRVGVRGPEPSTTLQAAQQNKTRVWLLRPRLPGLVHYGISLVHTVMNSLVQHSWQQHPRSPGPAPVQTHRSPPNKPTSRDSPSPSSSGSHSGRKSSSSSWTRSCKTGTDHAAGCGEVSDAI